ncbi:AsmA family protein [Sphingomonas qomolangmaensis]|uniref:AsmA family protein n=1 Tax=Sphingomonas qomolangmaensis TaxID=2918765 RepID=A0ABY5L5X5_9SPHN|nr:AsmA family protein [Sphingomonas qomolangmaensis]UUL82355.1 AsmA family protein [Sphingomonas qomolangmaensis]
MVQGVSSEDTQAPVLLDPVTDTAEPVEARAKRRRLLRILRNVVIGILVTIAAIWLVLFITKGRFLKGPFERTVGGMIERQVKVGGDFQLYFAPFDIKFLAEGLTVSNPEWTTQRHLFAAKRIDTRIAPLSLLFGKRRMRWLDLTDASLDLEWNAARTANSWTFDSDGGGEPFEMPVIDRAKLVSTALRYRDPQLDLLADLDFSSIVSQDARIGDAVRFTGDGRIRKTPFTLIGALLTPNATVARGRNKLVMRARAANNRIDIGGTLPSLADIEGVPLAVAARGRNAAELLGILGIIVPQSRAYQMKAQLVKRDNRYRFDKMTGRFGDSDIAGAFTVRNGGPRVHIDADLSTRTLDIIDVAPFIGYNPDLVAKSGYETAARASGAAPARLLPDATLRAEGLRAFDADVRYKVARLRSDSVPVSDVAVTVALDDGLLSLSPFNFTMARGSVNSDVRIDWRRRPARTTYDFRLGATPMAQLLGGFGVGEAGTNGTVKGRLELVGDGDTLHDSLATSRGRIAFIIPQGTFSTRNVQLAELDFGVFVQKMFEDRLKEPVQINCGLVAFTVRRGVAAADPILIDTRKNVIVGRGGFSFATEQMDLAFRADGKKFSLFSAQSPVGIGGYFSEPSLDVVSLELLSRAGIGLGLAVLAAPPAALLAFVDVGDASSAACGPVLSGATATKQRTRDGKPRDDVGKGTSGKAKEEGRKKFLGIF